MNGILPEDERKLLSAQGNRKVGEMSAISLLLN